MRSKYYDCMMFLHNVLECCILTLLYFSVGSANEMTTLNTVKVTVTPQRFRAFETPVRLTVSYPATGQRQGNITRFIKIKILNDNNKEVEALNKTVHSSNCTYLDLPCETFSRPGRYSLQYFVKGVTDTFKELRQKIVVRREKIRIDSPKNHTAVSRSVAIWITSKHKSCQSYKDRVDLYWIKGINDHVLVTSREVRKFESEKRTRIQFGCHVFDTEGVFYFKYVSGYSNRTLVTSANMSVSWGKYKLEAQTNNIFPCSTSFAVKITAPYCDKFRENKVQIKSKDYNNVISSKPAYPEFRAVFFPCSTFKRHIHEYCFYYITKSSLTKKAKVHAKLCLPSLKTDFHLTGWSQWTSWGQCFSDSDCGQGRKNRFRYCQPVGGFRNPGKGTKHPCTGSEMQSTSCNLPPCEDKASKSCGCVFTNPEGIIVSPESLPSHSVKNKSSCHWWIKVNQGKRVKLWFDVLSLAKNSAVHIMDGNNTESKLLEKVTHDQQMISGDILGTSNVISVWYYFNGNLNGTNYGFQLSYSSIDKLPDPVEPTKSRSSTKPKSKKKRIIKMTFIGIFALIVVVMAGIFFKVFCKIRRDPCEQKTKTVSQPTSSSHTSTACVSETTLRSYYETPVSGDESVNNNSTPTRMSNYYRPRVSRPARTDNRASVHICPKCCYHNERCSTEYVDGRDNSYQDVRSLGSDSTGRKKLYCGSRYRTVAVETVVRGQRYSAVESFRTANSLPEVVAERHYERYL